MTAPLCLRDDGTIFVTIPGGTAAIALHPGEMRSFAAALVQAADRVEQAAADAVDEALERARGRLQ